MGLQKFNLANSLTEFDGGRIAAALESELKHAVMDCRDRPMEGRARVVSLSVELIPFPDDTGDVDTCEMKFQVTSKLPTRKSKKYSVGVQKNGELIYSENATDNWRQKTIDE